MYRYDEFDAQFVAERVAQFRGQVARRLSGELTEDQFKPLRLMNVHAFGPYRLTQMLLSDLAYHNQSLAIHRNHQSQAETSLKEEYPDR